MIFSSKLPVISDWCCLIKVVWVLGLNFNPEKGGEGWWLGVCGLAKVLKRLSFLAQTKVYLFWRKDWEGTDVLGADYTPSINR